LKLVAKMCAFVLIRPASCCVEFAIITGCSQVGLRHQPNSQRQKEDAKKGICLDMAASLLLKQICHTCRCFDRREH